MLNELRIKNFVIIEDLSISFGKGLNILTGETGAGKSILIDALSGILGAKMTTDMIRTGFEKASLEALFDISGMAELKKVLEESGIESEDDSLIIRRELFASGKGRSFVNAVQIPASRLREISEYLVDIHGQNEHQNIMKVARHREILDSFAGTAPLVERVNAVYNRLSDIKGRLESYEMDEREKARRVEFNTYSLKEIEAAGLKPGEDEELKAESTLLSNAENLFREVSLSAEHMKSEGGIIQRLKAVEQSLARISEFDPDVASVLDSVRESLFSLEDGSAFLRDYERNINFSPERVNQVEERLALISSLKKKYGGTIEEILEYAEKAKRELDAIGSGEEEKEKLREAHAAAVGEAKEAALELSGKRKTSAVTLESLVEKELADLGMSETSFRISVAQEPDPEGEIESGNKRYLLYPHGLDRVEFFLSANRGEDLRQLRRAASGGEMSRIMLAIKNVILAADIVDSIVFDEVDAGISGKIAEIVGKKLKLLSKDRQVLVITHLPQIAAMSDSHFSVQKGRAGERVTTVVKHLSRGEKIREVARLLAGEKVTELSQKHAAEMVQQAESN